VATVIRYATADGFPQVVASRLASTVRASTSNIYQSKWAWWCDWCSSGAIGPCDPPLVRLCVFFNDLHVDGLSLSTVEGYRSALHTVFQAGGEAHLVADHHITGLFKAFGVEQPVCRRLFPQ